MPLSEHEQRLLEQMERALYEEDPKFAAALEETHMRSHTRKRVVQAAGGFVVGVALLMTGVVFHEYWPISVLGFLVMLGCALLAVTSRRAAAAPPGGEHQQPAPGGGRGRQKRRVTDRLEERWQRRQDEGR